MRVLYSALVSALGLAATGLPAAQGTAVHVAPQERLLVAALYLGDDGDRLQHFYERQLTELCGSPTPGGNCWSRLLKPNPTPVGVLYSAPSYASAPFANVVAVPVVFGNDVEQVGIRLDIQRPNQVGVTYRWTDAADWGYGLYLDGDVRLAGVWVQLLHPPTVAGSWLPVGRHERLDITVNTIEGHILELEPIPADVNRGFRGLAAGSYHVGRVADGAVELRAEIDADMPCGEEIRAPTVLPPTLTVSPQQLFDPEGRPRFRTKYTKGC